MVLREESDCGRHIAIDVYFPLNVRQGSRIFVSMEQGGPLLFAANSKCEFGDAVTERLVPAVSELDGISSCGTPIEGRI